jgi:hypothetical protein
MQPINLFLSKVFFSILKGYSLMKNNFIDYRILEEKPAMSEHSIKLQELSMGVH